MTETIPFSSSKSFILMYHSVLRDAENFPVEREIGAELYEVSIEKFQIQMSILKEHNYHVVKVDKFNTFIQQTQVALTFDDGEMNNFTNALPVLKQFGFSAYFFVILDRIGKAGYMGWDELRQMLDAGMVVGSHGLSHKILTDLTDVQVEEELRDSRKHLINRLGSEIDSLSIPRGFCNDRIMQIAYEVGYRHIFISERPAHLKARGWERVAVKASWDIQRFKDAINGEKPVSEKVLGQVKRMAKNYLSGEIYNRLRNAIVSISSKY
jgi:peptidoglycan/xylan/chitin deacetylase (PgdA/CDA1 family)